MDKFEYKGKAEIKHLNVRKEGQEDAKELAVDIKIQCVTSADMLDFFHDGLKDALFTDVGAVKNVYLSPIAFSNKILNCELNILEQRYYGVDAGKFTFEPKDDNRVIMTFSVSIQPNGTDVAQLAEFVMDEVNIHILPQPQLDFSGAEEVAKDLNEVVVEDEADALYDQAVSVVLKQQRASISLVQRNLKIGYNRAARLIERMEKDGVVSAMESNGNRAVLKAA